MLRALVNQIPARAIHGLHGEAGILDLREIHVILVVIVMPALLPQFFTQNDGGLHFHVTCLLMRLTPKLDQRIGRSGRDGIP